MENNKFKNHNAFKLWPSQLADVNTAHSVTPARNLGHYTQQSTEVN